MASAYMTAAQVGSYFVTQYYQMLQQSPEYVHQLYSDVSTMIRIDGQSRDTGGGLMQIHALVMSLRYSTIEIKTAHSLESWNGGVVVMVTGSLQMRDFSGRKKFAQTFFLAPQEKGYFVLNDIFHFIDEEQVHSYPVALIGQSSINSNLADSLSTSEQAVPNYLMGGTVPTGEYITPAERKENGTLDQYSVPEQRLQQVQEPKRIAEDSPSLEHANGYLEHAMETARVVTPSPVEEAVGEPQKHTYASILRVAKGHSGPSTTSAPFSNKNVVSASEWYQPHQDHQSYNQQSQQTTVSSAANESLAAENSDEILATDDKGEIRSVYVRGLAPTLSAIEIEEEFERFGKVGPGGVAIRRVKDTDVCYAFVEFEDMTGAQNAIQAATVEVSGHQVYIEERRANSTFARGRRGRGRGNYQSEPSSRGRFGGRSFGRGGNQGNGDYSRSRGNGFHRQTSRADRSYSGNQGSRNGYSQTEVAA